MTSFGIAEFVTLVALMAGVWVAGVIFIKTADYIQSRKAQGATSRLPSAAQRREGLRRAY